MFAMKVSYYWQMTHHKNKSYNHLTKIALLVLESRIASSTFLACLFSLPPSWWLTQGIVCHSFQLVQQLAMHRKNLTCVVDSTKTRMATPSSTASIDFSGSPSKKEFSSVELSLDSAGE
jgi:hypothetical protein